MTTNNEEVNEHWTQVRLAADRVQDAYDELVAQSDELAKLMLFGEDYVLRRVFPKNADTRRNSARIIEWVEDERKTVTSYYVQHKEAEMAEKEREAILRRLNLTPEEKAILGIS